MQPVVLGSNQPTLFYRGGEAIAELRGVAASDTGDGFRPEDWIASTTPRFGQATDGLSLLPDGRYLRDVIEAAPTDWLGPDHVEYFGTDTALLVKLLEAGQRLPVHVHPDRSFALRHLGSRHGKTEAWVVLGTYGSGPVVYLGWTRDVEPSELARWVAQQDKEAMLGQMHRLEVEPGDALFVPAGTPHAVGEGVFLLEPQEPTDFSIMLEIDGFGLGPAQGYAGLDRELAISCVRGKALRGPDVERLRLRRSGASTGNGVQDVLPDGSRPYFRVQRVFGGPDVTLEPSFAVVVAASGNGALSGDGWRLDVQKGTTAVVPWAAGPSWLDGQIELLRCLPPLPADAAKDDPGKG
jgi:mannose-6-phosphate isomerase